jgi:hypothetical protein
MRIVAIAPNSYLPIVKYLSVGFFCERNYVRRCYVLVDWLQVGGPSMPYLWRAGVGKERKTLDSSARSDLNRE